MSSSDSPADPRHFGLTQTEIIAGDALNAMQATIDELCDALAAILLQADDGVRDCVGVMRDGSLTFKGSFLAQLERARAALSRARGEV